jgi:hypothetical protein
MAIYRIMCSQITYYAVNIEADNEQDAIEISNNLDLCEFRELDDVDWQIDHVDLSNEINLNNYPTIKGVTA